MKGGGRSKKLKMESELSDEEAFQNISSYVEQLKSLNSNNRKNDTTSKNKKTKDEQGFSASHQNENSIESLANLRDSLRIVTSISSRISEESTLNLLASLEESLEGLSDVTQINSKYEWACICEFFIGFLRLRSRSPRLRTIFTRKIQLILSSPHCSDSEDLSALISEMDKSIGSLKDLNSADRLSVFVFFIEKLIISNLQKNIFEIIRICATLASTDKSEYLDGLALLICSEYSETKQLARVKAQNGERIDCLSMILLDMAQRISTLETITIADALTYKQTTNNQSQRSNNTNQTKKTQQNKQKMNQTKHVKDDLLSSDENIQITAYQQTQKHLSDFLKNLFKQALPVNESTQQSYSQQQMTMHSQQNEKNQQQSQATASKKEMQRAQSFLTRFAADVGKQVYSAEFSMAAYLFSQMISIIKSNVEKTMSLQTNGFLIEITKVILKVSYFDTITIADLAVDMQMNLHKSHSANKRNRAGRYESNEEFDACNICGETSIVVSLKQNVDVLAACTDCSNLKGNVHIVSPHLQVLIQKIPHAFETALMYYMQHMYRVTINQNYLHARSAFYLSGYSLYPLFGGGGVGTAAVVSTGLGSQNSHSSQAFISSDESAKQIALPEGFGSNLELDFLDFIYKVKVQQYFAIPELLKFLLKYICALTDDNATQIRNKSLQILREIEGFNRSDVFEKYLSMRRLDSAVAVRLTSVRILEQLFTADDQTQYESDEIFRSRKDRYFKMIIERFNDKEAAVRGAVLAFISDNVSRLAKDKQLKNILIRQLVLRLAKDSTSFQLAALQILTQIYFPSYHGSASVSHTQKRAAKVVKKMGPKKGNAEGKQSRKRASLSYQEEEATLGNILELQQTFEVSPETLQRIAVHFQEHQPNDANVFLSRLLQVSLKFLEESIASKMQRQYVLGVIEVLSKLRTGNEMSKEFEIFVRYFDQLVAERASIPLKEKDSRAELNLCLIIILDILSNIFKRNAIPLTPSSKNMVGKLETTLIQMMSKEGNIYVLKKLVEVSAHSVNQVSMNVQRVLDVFSLRYRYLRSLSDDEKLASKVVGVTPESELLVFHVSMSIHIMAIYAYHFSVGGSLRGCNVSLKDLVALLVSFIALPSDKIQAASFENLALLWEKEYELIFTCQDILADLISNPKTSESLLVSVYTIFHNYILKHIAIIDSKASKVTTIKSKAMVNEEEDEDQQFEHITQVIRDLVLRSYEQYIESPCLILKQSVLRLLGLLIREKLVLFQQIGVRIIPLLCDADPLVKTLANAIIHEQAIVSTHAIGLCLKAGLKRAAQFIDQNNKVFSVTESIPMINSVNASHNNSNNNSTGGNKQVSLFERLNLSLRIRAKSDGEACEILVRRSLDLLAEIEEWSYEDHEIAFFVVMLLLSLNTITRKELLFAVEKLRSLADKLFHDVNDFLKNVCSNGSNNIYNKNNSHNANSNDDTNDEGDDYDEDDLMKEQDSERQFIKANVILMCLTCAHMLIVQSAVFPAKFHSLDVFVGKLSDQIDEQDTYPMVGNVDNNNDDFQENDNYKQQSQQQQQVVGWQSVLRKFDGDAAILDATSDLFLEQMRDFDCSDEIVVGALRAKIKHLMFDFVEADVNRILDLTYSKSDAKLNLNAKNNTGAQRLRILGEEGDGNVKRTARSKPGGQGKKKNKTGGNRSRNMSQNNSHAIGRNTEIRSASQSCRSSKSKSTLGRGFADSLNSSSISSRRSHSSSRMNSNIINVVDERENVRRSSRNRVSLRKQIIEANSGDSDSDEQNQQYSSNDSSFSS